MKISSIQFITIITLCFAGISYTLKAGEKDSNEEMEQRKHHHDFITLPWIDISDKPEQYHVIVAQGTEHHWQGHPSTVLMPDGKTIFCVWQGRRDGSRAHGAPAGYLKRSDDGGLTWTEELNVPPNWLEIGRGHPTIHRLVDPEGVARLFVFCRDEKRTTFLQAVSEDKGKTWSEMRPIGLIDPEGAPVVGWTAPISILEATGPDGRRKHLMWYEKAQDGRPSVGVIWQSASYDGGLTWGESKPVVDRAGASEPGALRSPDGRQLMLLIRENDRTMNSLFSVSNDEGETWSAPEELPLALTGDRHNARYAPDGRLVIVFRPVYPRALHPMPDDIHYFTAWVGRYEDIVEGREGQYLIKLIRSHRSTDHTYPGLEVLPDGTIVATTYIQYHPDPELHSVVSARFKLEDTDKPVYEPLLDPNWDPVHAGDKVLERMISVTAPHVKGAHDGDFVLFENHAYIVSTVNDELPGHSHASLEYVALSIVNLNTLELEMASIPIAKPGQVFENETLPSSRFCWVPRIIQINDNTLRIFFTSGPELDYAQVWYRDFDLNTRTFENKIHRAKLKTSAGIVDMTPQNFHADAVVHGFTGRLAWSLFIFDSFKVFDGTTYVGINNFAGRQNALAKMNDTFDTFEIVGHINKPEDKELSENSINRLPDGTWMAILRSQAGNRNYAFSYSRNGREWTPAEHLDFVQNGASSKPTFDRFNGIYYLGWQDSAQVDRVGRSVFNVDISRDGRNWERKYRFETTDAFEYPTFKEHNGTIWVRISGNNQRTIKFGKLETISN